MSILLRKQAGVISTAQLRACGLSSGAIGSWLRTGRLVRMRRGVYSASPYVDIWGRRWSVLLGAGPDAVLSRGSAAAVHGIGPEPVGVLHVTVPGVGGRRVAGIHVHRSRSLRPADVVRIRGLPVTSVRRTILDLAPGSEPRVLRRMIREAEVLGLLRAGGLRTALEGRQGHPGVAAVRRADPGTRAENLLQTPLEDDLARLIRGLPVPAPATQHPIRGPDGRRYRADFAWPPLRLVVEADGRGAHARPGGFEGDRARDADLAAVGWVTLRFTAVQVRETPRSVGDRIVRTALHRGWIPGDEPPVT